MQPHAWHTSIKSPSQSPCWTTVGWKLGITSPSCPQQDTDSHKSQLQQPVLQESLKQTMRGMVLHPSCLLKASSGVGSQGSYHYMSMLANVAEPLHSQTGETSWHFLPPSAAQEGQDILCFPTGVHKANAPFT